ADGSNIALIVVVCPADKITPDPPLPLNPGPLTITFEIVIEEFPVFVSVMFFVLVTDKFTFPNATLDGLALKVRVPALTVRVAEWVVSLPPPLLRTTWNVDPLLAVVVAGVV